MLIFLKTNVRYFFKFLICSILDDQPDYYVFFLVFNFVPRFQTVVLMALTYLLLNSYFVFPFWMTNSLISHRNDLIQNWTLIGLSSSSVSATRKLCVSTNFCGFRVSNARIHSRSPAPRWRRARLCFMFYISQSRVRQHRHTHLAVFRRTASEI